MELELLSPAGNMEKLKTAVYFGANAVYLSGKSFGMRAFAGNFTEKELLEAVDFCHTKNVKVYVTVNIVAHNKDFINLPEYLKFLNKLQVDGIIVSDLGIMQYIKQYAPDVEIHISTQANVTNKHTAKLLVDLGAKRIVLARELTLTEIKEIRDYLPREIELEAFVHGAMCISYSGRCLLSNFLTNRDGNNGQCIQACRWAYTINEVSRKNEQLPIEEDEHGTYILNSKDLNMLKYINDLAKAGVTSFKIEGRMKSPYYVATVTNAYRRAIDNYYDSLNKKKSFDCPSELVKELEKASHRRYTTGFNFKDKMQEESECLSTSTPIQTHEFMAIVIEDANNGEVKIEQRNKFVLGDTLEVLSPDENFNKLIKVEKLYNENGEEVDEAKLVKQILRLKTDLSLKQGDILRKKV